MITPPFTPLEAEEMGEGIYGDFEITMDGPQISPPSEWFPIMEYLPTSTYFVPSGEETTAMGEWISLS